MIAANAVVEMLATAFLTLTPLERWEAAHRLGGDNFMAQRWFIMTGVILVLILTGLFIVVSFKKAGKQRKARRSAFVEYADKRGLGEQEREILRRITTKAGLKRSESIFFLASAFDRGAAGLIERSLAQKGAGESKQLRATLSFLREKLGFRKQYPSSIGSVSGSKKTSSRQIPLGKKLHIIPRSGNCSDTIEATIVTNDDMELAVELHRSVESAPGELWRARYYFGTSAWEFDTSVIACDGRIMVLNHSDTVRFINRRRFPRACVSMSAFIAHFPFAKTSVTNTNSNMGRPENHDSQANQTSKGIPEHNWKPPEFVPAIVTELAGPGLRIRVSSESSLQLKTGDKVLVVFKLHDEKEHSGRLKPKISKSSEPKILEDLGEVKDVQTVENGLSIAVELIGLSDSNVDELIRVTNAASIKAETHDYGTDTSVKTNELAEAPVGL